MNLPLHLKVHKFTEVGSFYVHHHTPKPVARSIGKTITLSIGLSTSGRMANLVCDGLNPVLENNGVTVTTDLLTSIGIEEFSTGADANSQMGLVLVPCISVSRRHRRRPGNGLLALGRSRKAKRNAQG